jgi:hypothetical protein
MGGGGVESGRRVWLTSSPSVSRISKSHKPYGTTLPTAITIIKLWLSDPEMYLIWVRQEAHTTF